MIGYVTLGTNSLERATKFYDTLLSEMGAKQLYQTPTLVAYGFAKNHPLLTINTPENKNAATIGNGVMVALNVKTVENVDKFHALALSLGARDEGAAGPRGDTFYGGYFRDLDGNKLNVHCFK